MIDYSDTRRDMEAAFEQFKAKLPSEINAELVVKYLDENYDEFDEADEDSLALSMDVYAFPKGVTNDEDKYCVASLWLEDPEKAEHDEKDFDFAKEEAEQREQFTADLEKFFSDMEKEISPTEFIIKMVNEQNEARLQLEKELKKTTLSVVLLTVVSIVVIAAVAIVVALVTK
jgi:hypothetical protein